MTGRDREAVLDSLVWHSLATSHAAFAEGDGPARRFQPDVAPFGAVEADSPAAWAALAVLAGPDGGVLLSGDVSTPPGPWRSRTLPGLQMVLRDLPPAPRERPEIVPLGADDVVDMLALVELTQPGPFRPRTIELGHYLGVRDGDRLVAMAGERLRTDDFVEVSAVCTDPAARGRGLAAALSHRVATGILDGGRTPLLHVAAANDGARRVYERLGFVVRREVPFVIARPPDEGQAAPTSRSAPVETS